MQRQRAIIWAQTFLAVAVYVVAIWASHRFIMADRIESAPLAAAMAFTSVQVVIVTAALATIFARKRRNVLRSRRSDELSESIEEALALHALGFDQTARVTELQRSSRYDVRENLLAFISGTAGDARRRLEVLAEVLGFEGVSSSREVEEARMLLRQGDSEHLWRAMNLAAHTNLLSRAVMVEELERFAGQVSDDQMVRALQSPDRELTIAALDMLRAWQRSVSVPGFTILLVHPDPRVRARTLLALPYLSAGQSEKAIEEVIVAGLTHGDRNVRAAAATAAGKMQMQGTVAALAAAVSDEDSETALAAAFALARLGAAGTAALNRMVVGPDRTAAAFAFEALEKAAIGRLELA